MRKYELNHFGSIVFMLFLVFVMTTAVRAQDSEQGRRSEKWAVLIGVDDYAYAKDLKYCVADMQGLQKELTSVGFDTRQVLLLNDGATEKRLQPFKSNIEKQIELTCSNAEPGDLVLIAFSGHGVHADKVSYLCPTDAKVDDRSTLISLDWVYEKLQKCEADLKLVMVDACRNVPPELNNTRDFTAEERKDRSRAFTADAERLPQGILLLSSCSEGEFALEDVDFGQGVFMHFVLEGIRGKADTDRDKAVTLNELFRFASKETKLHVSSKFSDSQRPKLKGNLTVEALDFEIVSPGQRATIADEITNSIGMTMKLIPAGEFMMGSNESRGDLESAGFVLADGFDISDEHPEHKVEITKPFYLGIHEVTRGQFGSFVADTKYKTDAEKNERGGWGMDAAGVAAEKAEYTWQTNGLPQTDSHPVVNVSWNDAAAFCEWLSAKEGKQYRLPTEAEWEYSCKARTRTHFSTGDGLASLKGSENVMGTSDTSKYPAHDDAKYQLFKFDDGWFYTMPVGRLESNAFGLYDMHGNVSEWCSDWYEKDYYASSPQMDPVGATSGSFRVHRGGHWTSCAPDCRSARRKWFNPSALGFATGFRLALSSSVK